MNRPRWTDPAFAVPSGRTKSAVTSALAIPHRTSLVAQTVAALASHIERGAWREWLPPERTLCATLQISRTTLRVALKQLEARGLVASQHGAGTRILAAAAAVAVTAHPSDVALLTPEPLEALRPSQTLWIDELRALLSERGSRLRVFCGLQYFRADPSDALARLVQENPHGAWILALANEPVQSWFMRHRVPCVVAGSVYPGIELPFRDYDHRAICRHAAGSLLRLGHRRLVFFSLAARRAGDLESEAGFLEGVKLSLRSDVHVQIVGLDDNVERTCNTVRRLMTQRERPTGILVARASHYLSVVTQLTQLGCRVPQDVSVISRDDDAFLGCLVPRPSCFDANAHRLARALLPAVSQLLDGIPVKPQQVLLVPEFKAGRSHAAAPAEHLSFAAAAG